MKVLGMISGTSHDAIDTAVVELHLTGDVLQARVLSTGATPYSKALRSRLRHCLPPRPTTAAELCRLDTEVGRAFADAAAVAAAGVGGVDVICSHGQTLFHWTREGTVLGTLQIGQPAWIAELTGTPVVSDLRVRDVAAGGQGAPLVAHLDTLLINGMQSRGEAVGRAGALNLGGIANLTVAATVGDPRTRAYDVGPANALMDAAVLAATGEPFDRDGALAARGAVDDALLSALLEEEYYGLPAPKSTGKELFNEGYLERVLRSRGSVALPDLLATLAALTARTVADEIVRHGLDTVIVSGGGSHNPVVMGALAARLPHARLRSSSTIGVPGDAKEAIAFAVIGWHTFHGLPATLPDCTGATAARVLGALTPGAGPLTLPQALSTAQAPTRAVFTSA
ncbi:anhydro-N-acetylmuramic acid kinase [Streptomyces sp. NPDC058701]|uniref:anhydro-N-acetylmuramic acid kinase n=1 Tax=Streptomyces sp. NPDC058701 TaxID=3346608 RepID=UPI003661020D